MLSVFIKLNFFQLVLVTDRSSSMGRAMDLRLQFTPLLPSAGRRVIYRCIFLCFCQKSGFPEDACAAGLVKASRRCTYVLCPRVIDAVKIIRLSRCM